MPPGPRGWPLFGNLLQLDLNNPLPQFAIWREKFGKIFKFNLMGQNCVVVSLMRMVHVPTGRPITITNRINSSHFGNLRTHSRMLLSKT